MLTATDLARVAARFSQEAAFVGHALSAYRERERLTEAELAARLRIDVTALHHLCLCKLPRPECYDADVEQIAGHAGTTVEALRGVLAG